MNEKNIRLVTAESVRAGHPDKFCDQVADAILDAHLRQDPNARVAVEVFATAGKMLIGGEVTSKVEVDCGRTVADAIDRIGYTMHDLTGDPNGELILEIRIHDQSPDISAAVGAGDFGAGDQGIVVGYATNETEEYLPLPVVLAHRICKWLDELKPTTPWLGADGKTQVTVAYENDVPVAVTGLVLLGDQIDAGGHGGGHRRTEDTALRKPRPFASFVDVMHQRKLPLAVQSFSHSTAHGRNRAEAITRKVGAVGGIYTDQGKSTPSGHTKSVQPVGGR